MAETFVDHELRSSPVLKFEAKSHCEVPHSSPAAESRWRKNACGDAGVPMRIMFGRPVIVAIRVIPVSTKHALVMSNTTTPKG